MAEINGKAEVSEGEMSPELPLCVPLLDEVKR